jgi:hypothetical protein
LQTKLSKEKTYKGKADYNGKHETYSMTVPNHGNTLGRIKEKK